MYFITECRVNRHFSVCFSVFILYFITICTNTTLYTYTFDKKIIYEIKGWAMSTSKTAVERSRMLILCKKKFMLNSEGKPHFKKYTLKNTTTNYILHVTCEQCRFHKVRRKPTFKNVDNFVIIHLI